MHNKDIWNTNPINFVIILCLIGKKNTNLLLTILNSPDNHNVHTLLLDPLPASIWALYKCSLYRNLCPSSECISNSKDFRSRTFSTLQLSWRRRFSLSHNNRIALGWWLFVGKTGRKCSVISGGGSWIWATGSRWSACPRAALFQLKESHRIRKIILLVN